MRKIRFEMNPDEKKFPKSILNKNQTTQIEDETREESKTLSRIKRDQSEKKEPTAGILRVDCSKPRRSSGESVDFGEMPNRLTTQGEPSSPQPSIDRLSVTFAEKSDWSESSVKINIFDPGSPPSQVREMEKIRFVGSPPDKDGGEEAEDDYSASVSVIIQRRESMKRASSRRKKRRTSSPLPDLDGSFHDSRRRSSEYTNSSGDTAISIDNETTQEQIFENIRLHKEVLSSVKLQPWGMRRKIKLVQQAKAYVKRHEGELQERLAMSKSTKDILARFNIWLIKELRFLKRELANAMTLLIPWELRIKEIESHFGSAVASYFTFLRWMFWVNLVITIVLACFVAIPEMLTADWKTAGERKEMLPEEKLTATNLVTLWDFGGVLKYSPIFYGYYTNHDGTGTGYRLPFAYFLTGLAVYVYSFVATLRRMAENSRMSKLSEKDDECVFTWKIFTGWDYMIGNAETAHNRVASLILGFKEVLLEETERKKDEKNWKVICLRVLVSFIVIGLLAFSAYIVFVVVERSTQPEANDSWWRQNEITVSVSIISLLFPLCFELLGLLEGYHPRKSLRIQLARIMVLNLLNLYTLIFSQFWKISDMTIELQSLKNNYSSQYFQGMPTPVSEPSPPICFLVPINCTALPSSESSVSIFTTTTPISYQNITTATDFSYNFTFTSSGLDNMTTLMTDFLYSDRFYNLTDFFTNGTFNVTLLERYLTRSTSSDSSFSSFSPETSTTSDEGGSTTLSDTLFSSTVFSLPIQFMTNLSSSTAEVPSTLTSGEEFSNPADESWNKTDFVTDLTQNFKKIDQRMTVTEAVDVTSESSISSICLVKKCEEKSTNEKNVHSFYDMETRKRLRTLCWETMFGQELVKLTVMDLILTILSVLLLDFFRAIFVRVMNNCWCWDLEKKFPQYGDFKIAENILHLVYNQGMVWMGMFFSPGLPAINLIKLAIMMYLRSWAVLTCNVPHEVVFRASRSNNFYLALLLTMLFLCVLPVGYAIVWIEPSWHCGPFSDYKRIYHLFTKTLQKALPKTLHKALDYIASPGIIIPLLMLLVLIIYYLVSLTNSLREANNDLKIQLRRERTEERRKMFQMVNKRVRKESKDSEIPFAKWRKLLPELAAKQLALANDVEKGEKTEGRSEGMAAVEPPTIDAECKKEINRKEILARLMRKALKKSTAPTEENVEAGEKSASPSREEKCQKSISRGKKGESVDERKTDTGKSGTGPRVHTTGKKSGPRFGENDGEEWKKDKEKHAPPVGVVSRRISQPENIPVIKISKTESDEQLLTDNIVAGRGKSRFIWAAEQVIGMIRNEKENSNGKDSTLEKTKKESQSAGNKTKSKKENENNEEVVGDFQGTVVNNYRHPPLAVAEVIPTELNGK